MATSTSKTEKETPAKPETAAQGAQQQSQIPENKGATITDFASL